MLKAPLNSNQPTNQPWSFFSDKLSIEEHVNFVLFVLNVYICWNCWETKAYHPSSCRQYLLPWYCYALHNYALSVWGGHLTNQQRQRINAFLKRAKTSGLTEALYSIEDLLEKADTGLFRRLKTLLVAFILFYSVKINLIIHSFWEKEGIYEFITCIKICSSLSF